MIQLVTPLENMCWNNLRHHIKLISFFQYQKVFKVHDWRCFPIWTKGVCAYGPLRITTFMRSHMKSLWLCILPGPREPRAMMCWTDLSKVKMKRNPANIQTSGGYSGWIQRRERWESIVTHRIPLQYNFRLRNSYTPSFATGILAGGVDPIYGYLHEYTV